LFLFAKTGVELLWIGFIGALATYFYYKLKFAALGDFVIFIVYGPLIGLGTAFVMTDQLMWNTVLLNIPVAFLVVNISSIQTICATFVMTVKPTSRLALW